MVVSVKRPRSLMLLGVVVTSQILFGAQCWAETPRDESDPFKLSMALSKRYFLRLSYTYVKPNFKSSQPVDVDGPIVKYGDETTPGLNNGTVAAQGAVGALYFLSSSLRTDHPTDYQSQGLGTPQGTTLTAGGGDTLTLTLGTYLDDRKKWSVEAYVLGLPITTTGRGTGRVGTAPPPGSINGESIDLGEVMTSKQFGPIAVARYVFGNKDDRFRPSIGFGLAYIFFYDVKASESLTNIVGGPTNLKIDNAFGAGPFLGFEYKLGNQDKWSLFGSLGYLKMKTTATATTYRTDPNVLGTSMGAFLSARDEGPTTLSAVQVVSGTLVGGAQALNGPNNLLPGVLTELARARTGDPGNLGAYRRRIDTEVNPYVFTMGIGYAF